jgi:hypothetical protein
VVVVVEEEEKRTIRATDWGRTSAPLSEASEISSSATTTKKKKRRSGRRRRRKIATTTATATPMRTAKMEARMVPRRTVSVPVSTRRMATIRLRSHRSIRSHT